MVLGQQHHANTRTGLELFIFSGTKPTKLKEGIKFNTYTKWLLVRKAEFIV